MVFNQDCFRSLQPSFSSFSPVFTGQASLISLHPIPASGIGSETGGYYVCEVFLFKNFKNNLKNLLYICRGYVCLGGTIIFLSACFYHGL